MNRREKSIPISVRMRAYQPHALIALITLGTYFLLFQFFIGNVTRNVAELMRVRDARNNEIVFAGEPNPGETFYYLKQDAVSGGTNENALSDILMLMPDTLYGENSIYFDGTLESGTCAVSANIAARYALDVGDCARIIGTDKHFSVARVLPAEAGIDEDYLHEGLIILAFDADLTERNVSYVTFCTDGDAYRSLHRLVFVEDMAEGCVTSLCLYALASIATVTVLMAVCERFLFRRRRNDYACYVLWGVRKKRLFWRMLSENVLKYMLPSALTVVMFAGTLGCYRVAYAFPAGCFLAVCAVLSILDSLMTAQSNYKRSLCRRQRRNGDEHVRTK